jgi:outer membrane lipoprotein-sorting protein
MKKLPIILCVLLVITLISCVDKSKDEKSGPISSFYLEQKGTSVTEGMPVEINSKIWFNAKTKNIATEMEYKTEAQGSQQSHKSLHISNEEGIFMIDLERNTVYKIPKESGQNIFEGLDTYDEDTFIKELEQRGKIVDHEKYLGRKCMVFETEEPNEVNEMEKTTYWFYKGMPLKMTSKTRNIETVVFDENARIPADRFTIPEGLKPIG